jgi:hypothetical protein
MENFERLAHDLAFMTCRPPVLPSIVLCLSISLASWYKTCLQKLRSTQTRLKYLACWSASVSMPSPPQDLVSTVNGLPTFSLHNTKFSPEYNANAIGDKDSEWVKLYTDLKEGAFHPLFFLIPAFDTKYRHLFPRRMQLHQDLKRFLSKIEDIIAEKRTKLAQGRSQLDETEKDLCTLMLEAEANGEGSTLSNSELMVSEYSLFVQLTT